MNEKKVVILRHYFKNESINDTFIKRFLLCGIKFGNG